MNRQVSYNWIKEYVKLKVSAEQFAADFSLKSQTVDKVTNLAKGLDGVGVGQVVELKVGDQLPIAIAPTILPTGKEIKQVKMRGVDSQGMCCLDSELGFS